MNNKKLSCIVLSCDSHINKGNSVISCLRSIYNQRCDNEVEVILVENSHDKKNLKAITDEITRLNNSSNNNFLFKLINNKKSISRGLSRNIGVKNSHGDILIFIDDDTIIIGNNVFNEILKASKKYRYGFGANRLWIKKDQLKKIGTQKINSVKKLSHYPQNKKRGGFSAEILTKTFIGNFGFCNRDIFLKVNGFYGFIDYGFEDDYLMYKLFCIEKKYALLKNISVLHVDHQIPIATHRNLIDYFCKLIKENVYWFHSYKLFQDKCDKSKVIECLKTIHYDYLIQKTYEYYKNLKPLDIKREKDYIYWKKNNQYSIQDFSRLLHALMNSDHVNNFIEKSSGDFDNLAIVMKAAIKFNIIKVDKNGKIKKNYDFKLTRPYHLSTANIDKFKPDDKLNQFPCNEISRHRRFELIKNRYPFVEYLRIAIIGDDDFLSSELINDYWIWPIIIEKDERIIRQIKKLERNFDIIKADISDQNSIKNLPKVKTFITDPPYTFNGSLAFIYLGLNMLEKNNEKKEFYVIMNRTMMGSNLYKIEKLLVESGVYLKEIIQNFSQYNLPDNFKEIKRAHEFLFFHKIKSRSIELSSSSNLYIFETINPNLTKIKNKIKFNKLYQHYL